MLSSLGGMGSSSLVSSASPLAYGHIGQQQGYTCCGGNTLIQPSTMLERKLENICIFQDSFTKVDGHFQFGSKGKQTLKIQIFLTHSLSHSWNKFYFFSQSHETFHICYESNFKAFARQAKLNSLPPLCQGGQKCKRVNFHNAQF